MKGDGEQLTLFGVDDRESSDDSKMNKDIELFANRELKAKKLFSIREIEKKVAYNFIRKYHYLKDAKFFAKFSYGLFINNTLVGCATYNNPQGIAALKSWFGLDNQNQTVMELGRLCMLPKLNGTNATSYMLSNSMKMLKAHNIVAVITLADDSRHVGSIYQVCNFKYYGLTDRKTDFYCIDGRVNPRGKTKDLQGVWLPRTRKHRYCFLLSKAQDILLNEKEKPKIDNKSLYDCCSGTNMVHDKRFDKYYSCPKCSDKFEILKQEKK